MGIKLSLSNLLLFIGCLNLISCNHLFFQPTKTVYTTPENFKLHSEDRFFLNRDGVKNHILIVKAVHTSALPNLGKVFYFHGNGQNVSSHFLFTKFLADFGFEIHAYEFRGYGKSSGSPNRAQIIQDITEYLLAQCEGKSAYQYIYAQSLGGSLLASVLKKLPVDKQRCFEGLAIEGAFGSYRGMAQAALAKFWLTYPLQIPLSLLISDSFSPSETEGEITIDTMHLHSRRDPVVDFDQGLVLGRAVGNPPLWIFEDPFHLGHVSEYFPDRIIKFLTTFCQLGSINVGCMERLQMQP